MPLLPLATVLLRWAAMPQIMKIRETTKPPRKRSPAKIPISRPLNIKKFSGDYPLAHTIRLTSWMMFPGLGWIELNSRFWPFALKLYEDSDINYEPHVPLAGMIVTRITTARSWKSATASVRGRRAITASTGF